MTNIITNHHPIHQGHGPRHSELHHGATPGDVSCPPPLPAGAGTSLQSHCRPVFFVEIKVQTLLLRLWGFKIIDDRWHIMRY